MNTKERFDRLEHIGIHVADTSALSEAEKSMGRMSRALEKTVNVYTEINMDTMQYRQINIHDCDGFNVEAEGDYSTAYQFMCDEEIHPDDAQEVQRIMSPENLREISADSNGVFEVVARYRMKNVMPVKIMESRAIFMRDEIPHYVVSIARDVTEEMNLREQASNLENILSNVRCGVAIYQIDQQKKISIKYVNDGLSRLAECSSEELFREARKDALHTIVQDDRENVNLAFQRIMEGQKTANATFRATTHKQNQKWIDLALSALREENGSILVYGTFFDCTESREQQMYLIQSQRAVELAQSQGNLSIWTYNIDKGIIMQQTEVGINGHLGYPVRIENVPDCFIQGKSIYPDDIDKFLDAYRQLERGVAKVDVIYRIMDRSTQSYTWVHMFYQTMEKEKDADRMAVGFSMDANEQQEAMEHYHVEQRLREQMYQDAVLYIEYNLRTRQYAEMNSRYEGYPSFQWECATEEAYRSNLSVSVEETYLDEMVNTLYAENLLEAFENGENKVICEYRSKEQSGYPSNWYRATATMVKQPETDDVMAFIFIEDIEQEKERHLALESSVTDGIETIAIIRASDGDARLIRANHDRIPKDVGDHFTYDANFVERSHAAVIDDERGTSLYAALLSTVLKNLETQEIYQYSVSMKYREKHLKRHLFRFRYLDDRRNKIILNISDITAVYMEEQAKKETLQHALEEAKNASQAKAEFYSRMSHDMRTPMNGILGMTSLSEHETDVHVLKSNISKIQESGEYLLSLINDTLDLQRIESGKMVLEPKIVKTTDVVNNILDMIRVTAGEKGVNLKYSSGNAELNWYIRADELRLKQIFINLLSNGVKFTPKGGTVEFEFELLYREGTISHDVIYVRDTGVGMSEDFVKNKIFKPFSQETNTASTKYAGSGLGLSIAKSLVELMNGRIEVESELGVGTTFAVYLDFERIEDAEAEAELKKQKKEDNHIAVSLQDKKVLLVEDHPLNAEIARKLLEKAGCKVIWAQNGQEALTVFTHSSDYAFDVILMDIRMPVMDGLEAAKRIRALNKADAMSVPIIAMTANAYDEDMKKSLAAGMNAHLGKPIVPKDLYATLEEYIRQGND